MDAGGDGGGDSRVKEVYERYPYSTAKDVSINRPYPWNDLGYMKLVNSVFWGGKRRMGEGFRVLDAGCGSGEIMMQVGTELRGTGAEIVALDFSSKSLGDARQNAAKLGLEKVEFVEKSIMDMDAGDVGEFDYIICSAVLHHLESPAEGLKRLCSVLKDDGGMGLRLYGKYGRIPMEILQEVSAMVNRGESDHDSAVRRMEALSGALPPFHWTKVLGRNRELRYDVLLAGRTRSYAVPEVYSLLEEGGMRMARFADRVAYDPLMYTKGTVDVSGLSGPEKEALAELLHSRIPHHAFFATKKGYATPVLEPGDLDLVPVFKAARLDMGEVAQESRGTISTPSFLFNVEVKADPRHAAILKAIDGKRTTREVIGSASEKASRPFDEMAKVWEELYNGTKGKDIIVLNLP